MEENLEVKQEAPVEKLRIKNVINTSISFRKETFLKLKEDAKKDNKTLSGYLSYIVGCYYESKE